jgi:hypothetical protein
MNCFCPKPTVILNANYAQGEVSNLYPSVIWSERPYSDARDRRIRYVIFLNGNQVAMTGWILPTEKLNFAGVTHTPSVSTGMSLNFAHAYADVKAFLQLLGVIVPNNANIEMAAQVRNADNVESGLSNKILLNPTTTDCCTGSLALTINGDSQCWSIQVTNECLVEQ